MRGKACEVILYPEDAWTVDNIVSVITGKESIKTYAIILHDKDIDSNGATKKPHYHVYLSFGNTSNEFSYVAHWFNTAEENVEKIKSKGRYSRYDYLLYLLHKKQPEKHQYDINEIYANFDVTTYLDTHEQKIGLESIIEKCADGTINRMNYPYYIDALTYTKYKPKIERAWEYFESTVRMSAFGERSLTVIWISGKTRAGKSTLAKMFAKQQHEPIFITETGSNPFDGYASERIVCLDELRPNNPFTFQELLQLLDPHTVRAIAARYHNKYPFFETLFITSALTPQEFYNDCCEPFEEAAQLYRRIAAHWMVTQKLITVYEYSFEKGMFIQTSSRANPVGAYLETLPKPKLMNSNRILREMEKSYTQEQLRLTDDGEVFTEIAEDDTEIPFIVEAEKNESS